MDVFTSVETFGDCVKMHLNSTVVNVSQSDLAVLNYNGSYKELAAIELFQNYPDRLLNFAAVCCLLFMCIGIPGNLVTIIALARYEKVRKPIYYTQ